MIKKMHPISLGQITCLTKRRRSSEKRTCRILGSLNLIASLITRRERLMMEVAKVNLILTKYKPRRKTKSRRKPCERLQASGDNSSMAGIKKMTTKVTPTTIRTSLNKLSYCERLKLTKWRNSCKVEWLNKIMTAMKTKMTTSQKQLHTAWAIVSSRAATMIAKSVPKSVISCSISRITILMKLKTRKPLPIYFTN